MCIRKKKKKKGKKIGLPKLMFDNDLKKCILVLVWKTVLTWYKCEKCFFVGFIIEKYFEFWIFFLIILNFFKKYIYFFYFENIKYEKNIHNLLNNHLIVNVLPNYQLCQSPLLNYQKMLMSPIITKIPFEKKNWKNY
jgi:hypothetical protein